MKGVDPNDERYVLGIVLEPEVVDAQGDIYSADEIRAAAHRFMEELGGLGLIIPMTPKMRRFLFALLRQAGKEPTRGGGRGAIVVQVPARPFLGPGFDKFRDGASRRFLERVAQQLSLAP